MATPNGTAERILEGALEALARHGTRKFSMTSICTEANVSRRTLYRYFHNQEEVFFAVANHVAASFENTMAEAIRAHPDAEERLRVVLDTIVHYGDIHPAANAVLRTDPSFVLEFLEGTFADSVGVVREALEPVVQDIPAVRNGSVNEWEFAEIIMRIGVSAFFLPSPKASMLPSIAANLWASVLASDALSTT